MIRKFALLAGLFLSACAANPVAEVPQRRALVTETLPPMKSFGLPHVSAPRRANSEIARDFLDLSFQMESGRTLTRMSRFEGPITLRLSGRVPASVGPDLGRLLSRLRNEAWIDIRQVPSNSDASITVEFLPRSTMQALVPQAACFVMPRISSWEEFRRERRRATVDWTTLDQRDRVAIFVPNDTSPQEMRDCLHEEIAQAIGPLNDLYQLPDSVFNDDNFHTVLTGFDMLILRAYYAPELRSGMRREEVAARLPALLNRLNPGGGRMTQTGTGRSPDSWIHAIETALGPRTSANRRRGAAKLALKIAQDAGWNDCRLAFSYFAVGRLSVAHEAETAVAAFSEAARIYRSLPDTQIHLAHVDMQMAAYALSSGQAEQALELVNRNLGVVSEAENAALLASFLMIKSEALELLGRHAEAQIVRLDSLGWARYGFGSDEQVRARMAEIAVLTPRIEKAELR